MKLNLILLFILLIISMVYGTIQVDIPLINEQAFEKLTERDVGLETTLVMFKTEWCGHCKTATPIMINMAPRLSKDYPKMKLAFVDCDSQKSLCKKHRVNGYPAIRLYENNKNWVEYDDVLSEKSLLFFLNNPFNEENKRSLDEPEKAELKFTKILNDKDFDTTLKSYKAAIVYFTADWCSHCQRQLVKWDLTAEKLKGDKEKNVFVVDCESGGKDTCKKLKINGFPAIIYFANGKNISEYIDEVYPKNLMEFLANPKVNKNEENQEKDSEPESSADQSTNLLNDKFKNVQILNKDSFISMVLSPTDNKQDVMIMFMAPWCGACQEAAPEYDRIAGVMKTKKDELAKTGRSVLLAAVNCDDAAISDFCNKQKVEGYPTFIHFRGGKRIYEYSNLPLSDALVNYLMNLVEPKEEL